jgi:hypothetical protein
MINFKKMDEKDFVFINKSLSEKEEKAFSDFLKSRKEQKLQVTKKKNTQKLENQ